MPFLWFPFLYGRFEQIIFVIQQIFTLYSPHHHPSSREEYSSVFHEVKLGSVLCSGQGNVSRHGASRGLKCPYVVWLDLGASAIHCEESMLWSAAGLRLVREK